jgi:signal transduction histidine kinase
MQWQFSVYSYIYFLTAAVTLMAAWVNWRRGDAHGVATPALPMILVSLWSIFGGVELAAVGIPHKLFWAHLASIMGDLFVCFLFLFVLRYYKRHHWLTPLRFKLFWVPVVLSALLMITNPWHNLYWVGFEHGPPGTNLLFYLHGPAYFLSLVYYAVLAVLAIYVLYCEATQSTGWDQLRTSLMATSMFIPLGTYLTYAAWPNQTIGINLIPIGFSLCGLLISGVIYEDMDRQIAHHTVRLKDAVLALHTEIDNRERLEKDLLEARDSLATHLAQQSNKLAGLYNLILMAGQSLKTAELLEQSLDRLRALLSCDAICMYQPHRDGPQLQAQQGMSVETTAALEHLPQKLAETSPDVLAIVNTAHHPIQARIISEAGYGALMCKWVLMSDRALGLLAVFWRSPHQFAVEDIALFSALADELGVILENARLREITAKAAILEERRRVARDLHDSVAQSLHSLVMSAETAQQISSAHPERLGSILSHLVVSARQAVKEMRLLMYELRPFVPDKTDLVTALEHRLTGVERRAGLKAELIVEDDAHWPKEWETELYPIALEALNNAIKHAQASHIEIRLQSKDKAFTMWISDNGRGFNPEEKVGRRGGMGLTTMSERAERLGGHIKVTSEPDQGTRVTFSAQTSTEAPESRVPIAPSQVKP